MQQPDVHRDVHCLSQALECQVVCLTALVNSCWYTCQRSGSNANLKSASTHGVVQGLAPFGADIAVLVYNPAMDGSSPRPSRNMATNAAAALSGGAVSDAAGASTELQHERPELKILTWAHEEVAADALSITGKCQMPALYSNARQA